MAMEVEKASSDFPFWKPARRNFKPDSAFFASGNIEREFIAKQIALDLSWDEKEQIQEMEDEGRKFFCPMAGCGTSLNSVEAFEDHYNARHMATCSVCSRVYPTARLLNIHISEVHDSFFQAKAARGYPVYECLVEGCELKFKQYKDRQQHLVDKHKFPASFTFYKKSNPSKKQRQKRQYKKALDKETSSSMQVDEAVDGLVTGMSRLNTRDPSSPSTISFGRKHTRGLNFVPRAVQQERKQNSVLSAKME